MTSADNDRPDRGPLDGLSQALATFVAETRFEQLPPLAVRHAKWSYLDALGVSIAASGLEPACRPFVTLAADGGGRAASAVLGNGIRASAAAAALANGSMAHAIDFEDIHDASGMHPNASAAPAVLALAQAHGPVSGADLVVALTLGCDITCRLAKASRRPGVGSPQGFFEPGVMGAFGASAAASRVLGLTAEEVLSCWSLTLCQTSFSEEYRRSPRSHIRAVRDGLAAQTAVTSALLARGGVVGFERPFEGEAGFFRLYGYEAVNREALLNGLGERFAMEDMSYKIWPACRGTHVYIQAALELLAETRLEIPDIEAIEVVIRAYDQKLCEPATSKRAPQAAIDAKFSIPYTLAEALLTGRVTLGSFGQERLADPTVLALAAKVSYRIDNDQARLGDLGGGPHLTVRMRDGRRFARTVYTLAGSPAAPLSEDQLIAKFMDCASFARKPYSQATLDAIVETVLTLESLPDANRMLDLL